jgi:hypothetical protein
MLLVKKKLRSDISYIEDTLYLMVKDAQASRGLIVVVCISLATCDLSF